MKKKKKIKAALTASDKTRHLVNTTISKRYKAYTTFGLIALIMTLLVGIVYRPITQASGEYKLSQVTSFNNLRLSIDKKYMSSDEKTLAFRLKIEREYSSNPKDIQLEFSAKLKGGRSNNIDFKVYKGTSDYYEIVAKELPDKWSALKLIITTNDTQSNGDEAEFIFNRKGSEDGYTTLSDNIIFDNDHAAVRSVVQEIEQSIHEKDDSIPKQIEELTASINSKKEEVSKLKDTVQYQLGDEKAKTDGSVKKLESSIVGDEQKISSLTEQQVKLEEKLSLLNQKLEEYSRRYNVMLNEVHW